MLFVLLSVPSTASSVIRFSGHDFAVYIPVYIPKFVKQFYIVLQFEVAGLETAAMILKVLKKHCIGTY